MFRHLASTQPPWPLAAEWLCVCVQSGGTLSCVVDKTLSCILMTSPCWKGRTLPRWPLWGIEAVCLIQSVPWGNRGEKPVVCEGPFLQKELTEHSRRTEMPTKERGGPRHPWGGLGMDVGEEMSDLTLFTGWVNCVTIFKCQGHRLLLWYHCMSMLDSLSKVC